MVAIGRYGANIRRRFLPRLSRERFNEPDRLPFCSESIIIWTIMERQSATGGLGAHAKAGVYPLTSMAMTDAPFSSSV